MFTFVRDTGHALHGAGLTPFMAFFAYVWALWALRTLAARRYRPFTGDPGGRTASVIVPTYREPEELLRRVLASVRAEAPTELIVVVDGGDPDQAAVAADYADHVIRIPKQGKRAAIAAGFRASDPETDVVLVVDSDTIWMPGTLRELLRPYSTSVHRLQTAVRLLPEPLRRPLDEIAPMAPLPLLFVESTPADLLAAMDRTGVARSVLIAHPPAISNEFVLELAQEHPDRIVAAVNVPKSAPRPGAQLKEYVARGAKLLKIHPSADGEGADAALDELEALLQRDLDKE